jgi:hypothetical protein
MDMTRPTYASGVLVQEIAGGFSWMGAGGEAPVFDELGFDGREEALGHGSVPAVASATHAGNDALATERRTVGGARERAAAVRMVEQR